ncbi:unnamed protein product [Menidia menidia]|uniref:(Atlantic silverside) hypothetical protein n=1 Tax=Menidia menidia TaxID=238744 RepID=A0A8S4BGY4_9TELE|nr:unnamed protein product [Menidia menidia]
MRVLIVFVLLEVVVCTTVFLDKKTTPPGYKTFLKRHVRGTMNVQECDNAMQSINKKIKECKPKNTFILSTKEKVRSICQSDGEPAEENMTKSRERFEIIVCKVKKVGRRVPKFPNCKYTGNQDNKKIIKVQFFWKTDTRARYEKFINQHIKADMTADRCNSVITQKRITITDTNDCKPTNTFIRATTNLVKQICLQAGEPYGTMRKSLLPFDIVVCKLRNEGAKRPRCDYRGQTRTRRIAINCLDGFPVHFDRDIVHFEN